MEKQGEVWVRIPDFPDYAVSGDGRVMRIAPARGARPGHILKPALNGSDGYPTVLLYHKKQSRSRPLYRLVAENFIPNPKRKPCVNHVNGIKTATQIANLEWVTYSENCQHAYDTGLRVARIAHGETSPNAKLKQNDVNRIRTLYASGVSQNELGSLFDVDPSTVGAIVRGRTWKQ